MTTETEAPDRFQTPSELLGSHSKRPPASTSRDDCRVCFGTGRVPIPGSFPDGTRHTGPCSDCATSKRNRLTAWRSDPFYGGCAECGHLVDLNADGVAIPHRHGENGTESHDETEEEFVKRSRIPTRYSSCRLHNYLPTNDPKRRSVASWCAGDWPMLTLVLFGNHGTGKTHLAIGAMFEVFRRHNQRSRFWPVVNLLDRYKATFDEDRATESVDAIDAEMKRTPLLVLDDLGAHKGSEWAEERLFRLIDERYRERLPMIVTTNVDRDDLPPRLASRLTASLTVKFVGADARKDHL